jgi:hypothetical protein
VYRDGVSFQKRANGHRDELGFALPRADEVTGAQCDEAESVNIPVAMEDDFGSGLRGGIWLRRSKWG